MDRGLPWYFGVTVGGQYGPTKRFLQAIAAGREDHRFLGLVSLALSGRRIPARLATAVEPFRGTDAQRFALHDLMHATAAQLRR